MIGRRQFNKISVMGLIGLTSPDLLYSFQEKGAKIKVGQIGTAHSHAESTLETVRRLKDVFNLVGVVSLLPCFPVLSECDQFSSKYTGRS